MFGTCETVVEVEKVSKLYARQTPVTRSRLGRTLMRSMAGFSYAPAFELGTSEFWALRNVSFVLRRGEAIGIIGLNGSGKTTLLRMLAGQILPDSGEIRRVGNTASMIDLTAGFQTTASGKENIFLRGAALGRTRQEMNVLLNEIIDFAEIGSAIDAPVATYSSGMTMRLAFSIMISTTPDILLIDEILAVGDFRFRQKCLARIRKMRDIAAFVLVSHSMGDISRFCTTVIVLNKGEVVFEGKPDQAIEIYENLQFPESKSPNRVQAALVAPQFHNNEALKTIHHYWCDGNGKKIDSIKYGDDLFFHISFFSNNAIDNLIIGIPVWTSEGTYVTGFSTEITKNSFQVEKEEQVEFRLKIENLPFNPGCYISNLGVMDGPEFLYRQANPLLTVNKGRDFRWGVVTIPHEWTKKKMS